MGNIAAGFGFSSGLIPFFPDAGRFMKRYSHWFVYLSCMGFFFTVTVYTITNYRRAMNGLLAQLGDKNDPLQAKNQELAKALKEVKRLSGLLPICAPCKKVRDDKGYWNQIDAYIAEHADVDFSHGICPECAAKYYPNLDLYDDEPARGPEK